MFTLTLIAALGCGLNAGIFFAFSSFVMKALGNIPPAQGAVAMQRINIDVINPWFMVVFMGTAAASVGLIVWTLLAWDTPGTAWRIIGAALYLIGTFGVTIAFNVPLNNRLANTDPGSDEGANFWAHYLKVWTRWNTVRTAAALAACAALFMTA